MADAERLRGELYAAFQNRALISWRVFDELRKALGKPQAAALMVRAIESAGFTFSADTWQPGRDGCCHLHIRPGPTR